MKEKYKLNKELILPSENENNIKEKEKENDKIKNDEINKLKEKII